MLTLCMFRCLKDLDSEFDDLNNVSLIVMVTDASIVHVQVLEGLGQRM